MSVCEQLQLKTDTMEADMTWYDWVGISQEHGWSWSWIWGGVALDQLWWEQKTNQPLSPHRFIQSVRSVRLRSSARCSKFNFQSQSHKLGSAMPADHRGRISFILAMMSLNGFGMSEDTSWKPRWGEGVRLFPCSASLNFACERNRRWDLLSWKTNYSKLNLYHDNTKVSSGTASPSSSLSRLQPTCSRWGGY